MGEEIEVIYVALLGENIDVWKPVSASRISGSIYSVIEQPYDRASETWEFAPGTEVICEERILSDGPALVAVSEHSTGAR